MALKISITNIEKSFEHQINTFSIIDNLPQSLSLMEICNTKTTILKTSILILHYFEKEQEMYFIINKLEIIQKN